MKIKTRVTAVVEGKFDYDCIVVLLDGQRTEICFSKADQVMQYLGKNISLEKDERGIYAVELATESKNS